MTTPQMDWLDDQRRKRAVSSDDIVTRLRVIHCAADDLTPCGTCLPCQAADEIERLRAAGDALAEYLMRAWRSDAASDLVTAWKETRRG